MNPLLRVPLEMVPGFKALVIRDPRRTDVSLTHAHRAWAMQNDFWSRFSKPRLALVGGKAKARNDRTRPKENKS